MDTEFWNDISIKLNERKNLLLFLKYYNDAIKISNQKNNIKTVFNQSYNNDSLNVDDIS